MTSTAGSGDAASPFLIRAADLVGCRFRLRQRFDHPDYPAPPDAVARQEQVEAGREAVLRALPAPGAGFARVDIAPGRDPEQAERATREAMGTGAHVITGGVLTGRVGGVDVVSEVDILVRVGRGRYAPVMVSNHRVARASTSGSARFVPTSRLGRGAPVETGARLRHHTVDGYRLALAHLLLGELADGRAGLVGQDRTRAYVLEPARFVPALLSALRVPVPEEPRRVKQCASCRFWPLCEPRLCELDEISLVLPGGRADGLRQRGIDTVQSLIDAHVGEPSDLARAWRAGIPVLKRTGAPSRVPRADVEIDIDMEAYLDQGAYLWGAYDGEVYRAFVTWQEVGGAAEEANFAAFWEWLMSTRSRARAEGRTFAAYCYAAGGENYWMKSSARRFGGVDEDEVAAFIASEEWVDVFAYVRRELVGTDGLGLKVLGPVVGYEWDDDGIDGERSVALRRAARLGDEEAREQLLRYNEGDCKATRAVRQFLAAGAPGVPLIGA
ncbi:TM0106 family RecB-like putative nuclease [Corynebacterium liangguodongii]|uniref:Recombinase RecB n=1 Tax=Corynebacterium liangguodongii TaxID=2079535 RepID=A0A2S0WHD2_9CORY|nr:TM0106 family RecB-like putative nuclease [Corynebacterium liangguodongii]AWB85173.1 recombinase RecB [Corynebacterium liangguodongii]PWB99259.1 TM0106 family RecB-like putative nuclease [Corynebacterium liangguodongii]